MQTIYINLQKISCLWNQVIIHPIIHSCVCRWQKFEGRQDHLESVVRTNAGCGDYPQSEVHFLKREEKRWRWADDGVIPGLKCASISYVGCFAGRVPYQPNTPITRECDRHSALIELKPPSPWSTSHSANRFPSKSATVLNLKAEGVIFTINFVLKL